MRKIVIILITLFCQNPTFSQESSLPNQITLWNPYELKFTPDNKYLVASSPNDSKIWNLENLECITIAPNFYTKDTNSTDNCWTYLPDTNMFFFHQTILGNGIFSINADGKSTTAVGELGGGKFSNFRFDSPPSFFLTSEILLTIRVDKKYLPYISIEKLGETKPLFTAKLDGKNTLNVSNKHFTVLKGEGNIYYLLSLRSAAYSENAECAVTEINLDTQQTRVVSKSLVVHVGDNSNSVSIHEQLKLSAETPNFIILNLGGLVYAVRKTDGKVLPNADILSKFPEHSFPGICGERDGKLIVRSFDLGDKKGLVFHTFDFDSQTTLEQIMHFGIDIFTVKEYRIAISRNGKEFAIAYKWDNDKGFKVAYLDTHKMTMLRDKSNTVENFLKQQAEDQKAFQIAREKKVLELQNKPKEQIVARAWYAVIDKNNNRTGLGFKLDCDPNGNISGYFEYRFTPSGMGHTYYYDAQFEVTGHFIDGKTFVLNIGRTKFINDKLDESQFNIKTLTFEILINPTFDGYNIHSKELGGDFLEGYIDSHYF